MVDHKVEWVSQARFAPFLDETQHDEQAAWLLYEWNARVASALTECIHHTEVLLRNSMMRELARIHPLDYPWNSRLDAVHAVSGKFEERHSGKIAAADDIIAGVTLGFWGQLFHRSTANEELWRQHLRYAFPGSPGTRDAVDNVVSDLNDLRNRCAHQDSLLQASPRVELEKILTLVGWIDPVAEQWMRSIERVSEVAANRPVASRRDTIIFPVLEDSLEMYQHVCAYVCPRERSFQDVKFMGFYKDQEILSYFPEILDLRLPSAWSKDETRRLMSSDDLLDQHLGRVMGYGLRHGWPAGSQTQVFLLTGEKDTRTQRRGRRGPIPHLRRGRGSAFTQKWRYLVLSDLLAATTTDQLSTSSV